MTKAIATVSSVFAACDGLDAANKHWNREDVRTVIGGGGFAVIDPLIRAWRELKPLREVAPNTPAELLHQIAVSLEGHLCGFMEAAESRTVASQRVFEKAVEELSAQRTTLEQALEGLATELASANSEVDRLSEELEDLKAQLAAVTTEASQQADTIDILRGRIRHMEKDHATALKSVQAEQRELVKERERERIRTSEENAAILAKQRKELIAAAEQAENRLMGLLDKERQEAKAREAVLVKDITEKASALQVARERGVDLKARVNALEKHNTSLEEKFRRETQRTETLLQELDDAEQQNTEIAREFSDYKASYEMSGDLGSLREVITGLQEQLKTITKASTRERSTKPTS